MTVKTQPWPCHRKIVSFQQFYLQSAATLTGLELFYLFSELSLRSKPGLELVNPSD